MQAGARPANEASPTPVRMRAPRRVMKLLVRPQRRTATVHRKRPMAISLYTEKVREKKAKRGHASI